MQFPFYFETGSHLLSVSHVVKDCKVSLSERVVCVTFNRGRTTGYMSFAVTVSCRLSYDGLFLKNRNPLEKEEKEESIASFSFTVSKVLGTFFPEMW